MELTPAIGVGIDDLQHAARAAVDSIIARTKGDPLAQSKLLISMLRDRELIADAEVAGLVGLAEIDTEVGAGRLSAQEGYFRARAHYNELLAAGGGGAVALVLASSAVGSYTIADGGVGTGTVLFAKADGHWANRGALTGAIIGGIWGPLGAAVGGAVGGAVGDIVDHCSKT